MPGELDVLLLRGLPLSTLRSACRLAPNLGMTPSEYLVQKNIVSLEALYSAFAEYCGVPFLPERSFRPRTLHDRVLHLGETEEGPMLVNLYQGKAYYVIAPAFSQFEVVRRHLRENPDFARQIRIASPQSMAHAATVLNAPSGDLESRFPELSAKHRVSGSQLAICSCAVFGVLLGLVTSPWFWVYVAAGCYAVACASSGIARYLTAGATAREPLSFDLPERFYHGDIKWPRYTILVPLHKEAAVVPDLVFTLSRIDYPCDRLQILFLIEQDDSATLAAFPKQLWPNMEIIRIPFGQPRTKPRALANGLHIATGDYVTIFDAEDRPDPDQLRKAAVMFALAPDELACIQARLAIDNSSEGFFARQFALEYACLFDQLLPWCYRNGWPFPLGGTSNHFRKSALDAVGGWDKYNVTEDADLGIRLARFGYRSGVLGSSTYEEAPTGCKAWLAQRARWYKGWLQTICVHLRDPGSLIRQIGLDRAAAMAAIFVASLVMIALHPLFFGLFLSCGALLLGGVMTIEGVSPMAGILLAAGAVGYTGAVAGAVLAARKRKLRLRLIDLGLIPVYWCFAGFAFYRAVWDFARRPHHWHKTEHGVAKKRRTPIWKSAGNQ